jgi:hypothetical protein
MDLLRGEDKDGNIIEGYHIRMKGISAEAIQYYCEQYNLTPLELYEGLYQYDVLPDERSFDLLCGNKKIKFKMEKDWSVTNVSEFTRSVNFNQAKGILTDAVA